MANAMLEILDGLFFHMSPDIPAFKVRVVTSDFKF